MAENDQSVIYATAHNTTVIGWLPWGHTHAASTVQGNSFNASQSDNTASSPVHVRSENSISKPGGGGGSKHTFSQGTLKAPL